jgi:hypothetical protein
LIDSKPVSQLGRATLTRALRNCQGHAQTDLTAGITSVGSESICLQILRCCTHLGAFAFCLSSGTQDDRETFAYVKKSARQLDDGHRVNSSLMFNTVLKKLSIEGNLSGILRGGPKRILGLAVECAPAVAGSSAGHGFGSQAARSIPVAMSPGSCKISRR